MRQRRRRATRRRHCRPSADHAERRAGRRAASAAATARRSANAGCRCASAPSQITRDVRRSASAAARASMGIAPTPATAAARSRHASAASRWRPPRRRARPSRSADHGRARAGQAVPPPGTGIRTQPGSATRCARRARAALRTRCASIGASARRLQPTTSSPRALRCRRSHTERRRNRIAGRVAEVDAGAGDDRCWNCRAAREPRERDRAPRSWTSALASTPSEAPRALRPSAVTRSACSQSTVFQVAPSRMRGASRRSAE